jgi:hypothetical protein
MKSRGLSVLASVLLTCAVVAPAVAGIAPYVRLDYGANQLRMTDGNLRIREISTSLNEAGLPATFKEIGTGVGPSASVGLWILPGLRVGATYSRFRAVLHNSLTVPAQLDYADDLDFRMNEIGAEAAVRFKQLAGLTLGATVAQGRAELTEDYYAADALGWYSAKGKSHRTKPTFGGFVGLDQTNSTGLAGFVRVGFQYRDMGRMSSDVTESDATGTVQVKGTTPWLDYSGFYVRVGMGYDFVR